MVHPNDNVDDVGGKEDDGRPTLVDPFMPGSDSPKTDRPKAHSDATTARPTANVASSSFEGNAVRVAPEVLSEKSASFASMRHERMVDATINEMVTTSPLENEAETLLLRTLEERHPIRPRAAANGSSIFSYVSHKELGHDFGFAESMKSDLNNDRNDDDDDEDDEDREEDEEVARTQRTRRWGNSKSIRAAPSQRRDLTVEEKLFGLSSAISAKSKRKNVSDASERMFTDTQADKLANTANILFRRSMKKPIKLSKKNRRNDGESPEESSERPKDAKGRWGMLRDNVGDFKKSDSANTNGSTDRLDVESGDASDGNPDSSDERHSHKIFNHLPNSDSIEEDWDRVKDFLRPRRQSIVCYLKVTALYIMLPSFGVAAILYWLADNPPTGKTGPNEDPIQSMRASASWWVIFIGMRQVVIFTIAKLLELVIIDFFSLQTHGSVKVFGPVFTLLVVQSKGWPFLTSACGLLNSILCAGNHSFGNHWLFWQDAFGMFNERNPAGEVTSSRTFYVLCAIAIWVGIAVAMKRLVVGVFLGRQTFSNYANSLAIIMNKMYFISEIADLARDIERRVLFIEQGGKSRMHWNATQSTLASGSTKLSGDHLADVIDSTDREELAPDQATREVPAQREMSGGERIFDPNDYDRSTGGLSASQRARIAEVFGGWEEPPRGPRNSETVSIGAVLQFRRALVHMDTNFPFSTAFGLSDTRENCVASAQEVYQRLLLKHPEQPLLQFSTMATCALDEEGRLDDDRLRELIRIFRPQRDGTLTLVDFVRSIDSVYKELRLLRATVMTSSKIDKALENLINIAFYIVVVVIILSQLGFDPLSIFLSLSSIIVAFAFMISSASAKYFEGILFILVQRPYGIGDRINVSNPESDSSYGSAQGWIVDDVTLFHTTVILQGTNERATIANGVLAKSRIINQARSYQGLLFVHLKFDVSVPYDKIALFQSAVEKFVKSRPREWVALLGFRAENIRVDQGFIEYVVVLQHRGSWQDIGPMLDSKSTMNCFCLELSKKLGMHYKSPPLPVNLNFAGNDNNNNKPSEESLVSDETAKSWVTAMANGGTIGGGNGNNINSGDGGGDGASPSTGVYGTVASMFSSGSNDANGHDE